MLHVDGRAHNEFDDFVYRMKQVERCKIELEKLVQKINAIGNKFGALPKYFRDERNAVALPDKDYKYIELNEDGDEEYGLRLYCVHISDSVVLLMNGDMKTDYDPEKCNNCKNHFKLANQVARAVQKDIKNGKLSIYDKVIEMDDDYELIF